MATRSTIALEYADGTIGQVYCHWDGYLEHNGVLLSKHYSNPFILRDLIDLGDISSLKPTVGTKHAFSRLEVPMDGEAYDKLYGDMTTFYGRDRGESGTMQKTFIDFQDYMVRFQHEEYAYILRKDGQWYVKQHDNEFELLAPALAKCNVEECVA
jgi:hypothetical protein